MNEDIRWKQRFNNYVKAFRELESAVVLTKERALSKLEKQGLIQGFEYTHELSWNLLKDYLTEHGYTGIIGSKDSTRLAFKNGLISEGAIWMEMIRARNLTSHSYDEALADEVLEWIVGKFYPAFALLTEKFIALVDLEHE